MPSILVGFKLKFDGLGQFEAPTLKLDLSSIGSLDDITPKEMNRGYTRITLASPQTGQM